MRKIFAIFILFHPALLAQKKTPQDFGYKPLKTTFKNDLVEYLVISKKDEELKTKPLFFFCQGSQPQPIIKYDDEGMYRIFPFETDSLLTYFHLVIVAKPSTPIIENVQNLKRNFQVLDSTEIPYKSYTDKNYLAYYSKRNVSILKDLWKKKWVNKKTLVVAGHSEGSTIAANMASNFKKITHLIYAGGNPAGRILSIIAEENQKDSDSLNLVSNTKEYWKEVCLNPENTDSRFGDPNKTTFSFSKNIIDEFLKLKIPVMITYGTLDWSTLYIHLLEIETIRNSKINFEFKGYLNTVHNFFPIDALRQVNYEVNNWDKVGIDWLNWIKKNSQLRLP
jgi:hypothetical protein